MLSRDSQTVVLSRQTILLVTAVGVGLLTLCYVLGVQVGKQSAALRGPTARGAGEDLQELPASIADQLKALQGGAGPEAGFQMPVPGEPAPKEAPAPAPAAQPAPPVEVKVPAAAKPGAAEPASEKKPDAAARWTLQLVSTPDPDEAQRMAVKARAAGFPAAVVPDKGLYKVRLTASGTRETVDATTQRLKTRGFKPFAIKVE